MADVDLDGSCYYAVLGIAKDASTAQVREAYRRLALIGGREIGKKRNGGFSRFNKLIQFYQMEEREQYTMLDCFTFWKDEDEGFCDFMQEMIFMMKTVEPQKGGNSFEELQGMLMEIMTEDEKLSMGFADLDPSRKRMRVTIFQ